MSKTPRTDELSRLINGYAYVPSTFARKLERENGELREALKDAREQLSNYGEASAGMGLPDFSRIDAALA